MKSPQKRRHCKASDGSRCRDSAAIAVWPAGIVWCSRIWQDTPFVLHEPQTQIAHPGRYYIEPPLRCPVPVSPSLSRRCGLGERMRKAVPLHPPHVRACGGAGEKKCADESFASQPFLGGSKDQAAYKDYMRFPKRLQSSDWWESIQGIPNSVVLRRIRSPLTFMTAFSFLVSILHCCFGFPGLNSMAAHSLLGSGLSLMLVFRTNSAYQRFQEGRKIWNDILDISRDLALSVALYRTQAGTKRIRIIKSAIQAFPFAMQEHVRARNAEENIREKMKLLLIELEFDPISKPSKSMSASSPRAGNRPLQIITRLLRVVNSIPGDGDRFTNRERVWLLGMVNTLSHAVGRCERLVQTPVPLSYARHTSRFVSVWAMTLPLAMVSSSRWLTAPTVLIVTWALFGILEIGHMIEDPFRRTIDLHPICEAIYYDCCRALPSETAILKKKNKVVAGGKPFPQADDTAAESPWGRDILGGQPEPAQPAEKSGVFTPNKIVDTVSSNTVLNYAEIWPSQSSTGESVQSDAQLSFEIQEVMMPMSSGSPQPALIPVPIKQEVEAMTSVPVTASD